MIRPIKRELIRKAQRIVRAQGMAPMLRIHNAQPKHYNSPNYAGWQARLIELEQQVMGRLGNMGAAFTVKDGAISIRMAGVTARSTMGLSRTLKNWMAASEKRTKAPNMKQHPKPKQSKANRPRLSLVGAVLISDPIPAPKPLDLDRRGNHVVYHSGQINHCPNCGRSHWHIGRTMAECAFCQTAIGLAGNLPR